MNNQDNVQRGCPFDEDIKADYTVVEETVHDKELISMLEDKNQELIICNQGYKAKIKALKDANLSLKGQNDTYDKECYNSCIDYSAIEARILSKLSIVNKATFEDLYGKLSKIDINTLHEHTNGRIDDSIETDNNNLKIINTAIQDINTRIDDVIKVKTKDFNVMYSLINDNVKIINTRIGDVINELKQSIELNSKEIKKLITKTYRQDERLDSITANVKDINTHSNIVLDVVETTSNTTSNTPPNEGLTINSYLYSHFTNEDTAHKIDELETTLVKTVTEHFESYTQLSTEHRDLFKHLFPNLSNTVIYDFANDLDDILNVIYSNNVMCTQFVNLESIPETWALIWAKNIGDDCVMFRHIQSSNALEDWKLMNRKYNEEL